MMLADKLLLVASRLQIGDCTADEQAALAKLLLADAPWARICEEWCDEQVAASMHAAFAEGTNVVPLRRAAGART